MTTETMRAATARCYGGPEVMAIEALPRPVPRPGQLLVKVTAFGVTRGDARIRGLDVPRGMGLMLRLVFGLTRPRRIIPGREFSGAVAAIGPGVNGWAPGDPVMGITDGMRLGAGAALQPGERLLVNGATGAVGAAALWIGAQTGAQVTAVASPANHPFALEQGAAQVADYTAPLPAGPYDVILDIAGTLPWDRAAPLLAPGGRLAMVTADLSATLDAALRPTRNGKRLLAGMVKETPDALNRALSFHAQGFRPVITTLPLDQIIEAHCLASSGHKRGNVVVSL
ncbi:MAG: zinc-binding dehydrogenase [Pararhodobacter sp.]